MLGNYKAAYEEHNRYKIVSDSIFNMEKEKKITQTAMQYEFDKKEAATRAEQEKKDAIAQEALKNRNWFATGLLADLYWCSCSQGCFTISATR
ncbi:MAG: hypothetical protein H6558_06720 [Lewinellaceae bacterium]|nr:hypothetical protein [Lewinellaceae bacterium]